MIEPNYDIVASAENSPYLLWQCLLFHASCVMTQGAPPTIVVHGSGPLLAGFAALARLGARIRTAASYRTSGDGEYTARNTAGSLLEADSTRPWTLICDPDFLFLAPLPREAESLCNGNPVSWDFVSYMTVSEGNRGWLSDVCCERGVDPGHVRQHRDGGVVPNFVRSDLRRDFAECWLSTTDALVRSARRTGDVPWVSIAWAFALAAWEMKLRLSLTRLSHTTYDATQTPESSLHLPILHYCYGDDLFDKRRHGAPETAAGVWSLDGSGGSVSAGLVRRLHEARRWFAEREVDVTDPALYRSP